MTSHRLVLDVLFTDLEFIIDRLRLDPLRSKQLYDVVKGPRHEIYSDIGHLDVCVLEVIFEPGTEFSLTFLLHSHGWVLEVGIGAANLLGETLDHFLLSPCHVWLLDWLFLVSLCH